MGIKHNSSEKLRWPVSLMQSEAETHHHTPQYTSPHRKSFPLTSLPSVLLLAPILGSHPAFPFSLSQAAAARATEARGEVVHGLCKLHKSIYFISGRGDYSVVV